MLIGASTVRSPYGSVYLTRGERPQSLKRVTNGRGAGFIFNVRTPARVRPYLDADPGIVTSISLSESSGSSGAGPSLPRFPQEPRRYGGATPIKIGMLRVPCCGSVRIPCRLSVTVT